MLLKQLSLHKKHYFFNMFTTHKSECSFLVICNTNQVTETYSGVTENYLNKINFLDSLNIIVPAYRGKKMFAVISVAALPVTLIILCIHWDGSACCNV